MYIENIIKNINLINENENEYNLNNSEIYFIPKEEEINIFLESIKTFGKIYNKKRKKKRNR